MTASRRRKLRFLFPATCVGILLLAAPASAAALVETPLRLGASAERPDAGDAIRLRISPENASGARAWAGASVILRYGYDAGERAGAGAADPDAPASNAGWRERAIRDRVTLDENARALLAWTVPAEARDHNLILTVASPEGETLATLHLPVGDAPPAMRSAGGSDDGRERLSAGWNATAHPPGQGYGDDARRVPGAGAIAVVGIAAVAGILGVTLRRRA